MGSVAVSGEGIDAIVVRIQDQNIDVTSMLVLAINVSLVALVTDHIQGYKHALNRTIVESTLRGNGEPLVQLLVFVLVDDSMLAIATLVWQESLEDLGIDSFLIGTKVFVAISILLEGLP